MNRLVRNALLASAALAGANCRESSMAESKLPLPRDGNIAIEEELCAARARATREAYDLFIARHPRHPLARLAREERDQMHTGAEKAPLNSCPPSTNTRP